MRLHLIDGTYELYRAHYAPRPDHRAPAGWDAKATVGVVSSLLSLLHEAAEDVTHIAVAFDNPIRSFRNDLFPDYKSDEGVPPELHAQFDTVEEAVRAIGVAVWSMREHEADDGLASGARQFADEVDQVRIMTPDKDLGQCIRGDRVVQVDRRQGKVTNEEAFRRLRGFGPLSMPDYLALTGDTADGIPGLAGFGEKSASLVIGAYGHLEQIPDDARAWSVRPRGAPQLAATLATNRDNALLYRTLATLVDTIPCAPSLDALRFAGVPRAPFEAWCQTLGARTLQTAPRRWA
jgi:5'-3' exonuclease